MPCRPVLVVDDDEDLRANVSELLECEGYEPVLAKNGKEALDILVERAGKESFPGCVLLDLMMPTMDGKQFLEALTRDHLDLARKLAIFMWTAKGMSDADLKKLPLGLEVLRKPVDLTELIGAVSRHCGEPDFKPT